jgi:hypothetical protein
MPQNQIYTAPLPTSSISTGPNNQGGGRLGEAWVADVHGKYYTLMKNGNIFSASCVPTGLAFPLYTASTVAFCLWNPLGSGVDVVPLRFDASYVSGTGVVGGMGFNYLTGAGAQIATAGPISAFTALASPNAPINAYIGGSSGKTSQAKVGSAATLTTAGLVLRSAGFGQQAPVSAGTSIWSGTFVEFDGSIGLAPGTLIYPTGTQASVDLFWQSLIWAEVPQ